MACTPNLTPFPVLLSPAQISCSPPHHDGFQCTQQKMRRHPLRDLSRDNPLKLKAADTDKKSSHPGTISAILHRLLSMAPAKTP